MIDIGILEPAGRRILLRGRALDILPALEEPDDLIAIELAKRMAGLDPRSIGLRTLWFIKV